MKKSKFTGEQIAFALRQAEGRDAGRRGLPEDGRLGADVLSLEAALRRP